MTFFDDFYIDQAYTWLCKQRKEHHWAADVWHLRWYWRQGGKERLIQ